MLIKTEKAEYCILLNEGLIINRETEGDYSELIATPELNLVKGKRYSDVELQEKLSRITKVGLSLTENCNFRCTYCPHVGMYDCENSHSANEMTFDTAKKTIDLVIMGKKKQRSFSNPALSITFYGGEPLMAFNLISKVVQYTKELGVDVNFGMTTNGSLLTKEVAKYLLENNFNINVSLDGPKSEHDKCRLTATNAQTWDLVMTNLRYIRSLNKEYFKSKVACLMTVSVVQHDLDKILAFIETDELFQDFMNYSVNWVKHSFLKPEFKHQYSDTRRMMKSHRLVKKTLMENVSRKLHLRNRQNITEPLLLSANCFPGGTRLFVNPDGYFNICERFPSQLSPVIGHVDTGYDLAAIRRLIETWEDFINRSQCRECEVWMLCDQCFSSAIDENGNWKTCITEGYKEALQEYIEILEERNEEHKDRDHSADAQSFMAGLS